MGQLISCLQNYKPKAKKITKVIYKNN